MAYDKTSKKKILAYAKEHSNRQAIIKFSISSATFYKWIKEAETGYVKPKQVRKKKIDQEKLKEYTLENPHLTTQEIANHFGNVVSSETIRRNLHQLGFSYKDNKQLYKERDEAAREAFKKK